MKYLIREQGVKIIGEVNQTGDSYTWVDENGVKQDRSFEGYESWDDLRQMMARNMWMELIPKP